MVATVVTVFLAMAYVGLRGERNARREAELLDALFCRDQLQQALDARRGEASGSAPRRPAATRRKAGSERSSTRSERLLTGR